MAARSAQRSGRTRRRCSRARALVILLCLGTLPTARSGWETGSSDTLKGYYWGTEEWIHGWGTAGTPMQFCPVKCTMNSDFSTHETPSNGYEKQWDKAGWKQPQYGPASAEEERAGIEPPREGFVQAGEATLCKKPYAVCDYPNGDVFVRHALQELQVKNTESLCMSSMKHFLCTLYRRRCETITDTEAASLTFGNQAVKPVCFEQCMDAYINCKFDLQHANLMCGEYIKAGWVSYQLDETRSDQCDSPAAPMARPMPGMTYLIVAITGVVSSSAI